MKSIMLSIKPKYCELIANGKKTIEVRKSRPKAEPPFKCYIYCTLPPKQDLFRNGHFLEYANELIRLQNGDIVYEYGMRLLCEQGKYDSDNFLCKKVIGEFICDDILQYKLADVSTDVGTFYYYERYITEKNYKVNSLDDCLNDDELLSYGGYNNSLYGWHISDLVIYDKAKTLEDFARACIGGNDCPNCRLFDFAELECTRERLKRPPQSWCYVEELGGENK